MSYQKYQTDALVLGNFAQGEADRVYALYTSEFGLIRARATGVRKEKSKMRYALQSYSRAHVGLVRGRGGWRLAGAHASRGVQSVSPEGLRSFARLAALLQRLLVSEERNEILFTVMTEAHSALAQPLISEWAVIELLSVARILHVLGYLSTESLGAALFSHTLYDEMHIKAASAIQKDLLESVNRAIAETQL